MRLTWIEPNIKDGGEPSGYSIYPRFFVPQAVVGVISGNGPTVILLQGGHVVPVDGTPEIIWEKVQIACGVGGDPAPAFDLVPPPPIAGLANRARQRPQPDDEQGDDAAMLETHGGPMIVEDDAPEPWPEHG